MSTVTFITLLKGPYEAQVNHMKMPQIHRMANMEIAYCGQTQRKYFMTSDDGLYSVNKRHKGYDIMTDCSYCLWTVACS